MTISWEEFENNIKEDFDGTSFVIKRLDHEINVLLQRRQAIMAKDVNPLVVQMDEILSSLNPSEFGGDYLYKSEWYKNLDLESWGIYKYVNTGNKEGVNDDILLVDTPNGIESGSELLIEIDTGEKVQRTVNKIEYSDYYEGYLIYLDEEEATWDRKYMPDVLYPKCIDPIDEKACVAYNPCTDDFYKLPEWDDDLPEYVESNTIPLEVKYGVAPYTWTLIAGELDGWSLENEITNDNYNTLYSNNTCNLPAIVQVTDYCGNKTEEYMVINVYSQTEYNLSGPDNVIPGEDIYLFVNGGSPPYTWRIEEQPNNINCSNGRCENLLTLETSGTMNIVITSLYSCGYINVSVTDKCGAKEIISISFNNVQWKRIYYFIVGDYSVHYSDSSHLEYDDRFNSWPCKPYTPCGYRPVLIEIRSVLNDHFTPEFLKSPLIYEVSEKLWNHATNMIPKEYGQKVYPFPEWGYIKGEQTEPWSKQYYDGFDSIFDQLPGGKYEWETTSTYSRYTYISKWKIFDGNGPYSRLCSRSSSTIDIRTCNDPTLLEYCSYQKTFVRNTPVLDYKGKLESLASLSLYPWKTALFNGGHGECYGYWPYYCHQGYDPDYNPSYGIYYTDCGRVLDNVIIYVKACISDDGYWKTDVNGQYYLENSWITV